MNDIIDFKSTDRNFHVEKEGLKNHTEREIDDLTDERFQKLLKAWKEERYPYIRINLVDLVYNVDDKATIEKPDKMYSFVRRIQHISIWGNIMSITWKHKEEKE